MIATTDPTKVNEYLAPFLSYLEQKGVKININDNLLNRISEYDKIFDDDQKASYHAMNDVLIQFDNLIKTGKQVPLKSLPLSKDKDITYDTLFQGIDKPFHDEQLKEEEVMNKTIFGNESEFLKKVQTRIPLMPESYSDDEKLMTARYVTAREEAGEKVSPLQAIEDLYLYGLMPKEVNSRAKQSIKDAEGNPPVLEIGYDPKTGAQEWIHSKPERKSFWDFIGLGEKKPYDEALFAKAYKELTGRIPSYEEYATPAGNLPPKFQGQGDLLKQYFTEAKGDYDEYVSSLSPSEQKEFDYSLKKKMGELWKNRTSERLENEVKRDYKEKLAIDLAKGVFDGLRFTELGFAMPDDYDLYQGDVNQLAEIDPSYEEKAKKYAELQDDTLGMMLRQTTQSLTFVATSMLASKALFGGSIFSLKNFTNATTKGAKAVEWLKGLGQGYITGVAVGAPTAFQQYVGSPYAHNDEKTVWQKIGRGVHESVNAPGLELLTEMMFGEWALAAKRAGAWTPFKSAVNLALGVTQEVAEEEVSGWFDDAIIDPEVKRSVIGKIASGQVKSIDDFKEQFVIAGSTLMSFGLFSAGASINAAAFRAQWGKPADVILEKLKEELPFRMKEGIARKLNLVLDELDELHVESSRGVNSYVNHLLAVYSNMDEQERSAREATIDQIQPNLSSIQKALLAGWMKLDANEIEATLKSEDIIELGAQLEEAMMASQGIKAALIKEFFNANDNFGLNKNIEGLPEKVQEVIIKNLPSMLGNHTTAMNELKAIEGMDKRPLTRLDTFVKVLYGQDVQEEAKKLKSRVKSQERTKKRNIESSLQGEEQAKALEALAADTEKQNKLIDAITSNLGQVSYSAYEIIKSTDFKLDKLTYDKSIGTELFNNLIGKKKNKYQQRIAGLKVLAEEANPLLGRAYNQLPEAAMDLLKMRYGYFRYEDEISQLDADIQKAERENKKKAYTESRSLFFNTVMRIGAQAYNDIAEKGADIDVDKANKFLDVLADYIDENETLESATAAMQEIFQDATAETKGKIEKLFSDVMAEQTLYNEANKQKKKPEVVISNKQTGEKITEDQLQKIKTEKADWQVKMMNAYLIAKGENPDLTLEEFKEQYKKENPEPGNSESEAPKVKAEDYKPDEKAKDKREGLITLVKAEGKFADFIDKFIVPNFQNIPAGNIEYGYKQLSKAEIEAVHKAADDLVAEVTEENIEEYAEKIYNLVYAISNFDKSKVTDNTYYLMSPAIRFALTYSFISKLGSIDKKYIEAINEEPDTKTWLGKIYKRIIEVDNKANTFDSRYKHIQYHFTDARSERNTTLNHILSMLGFLNPLNLTVFPESQRNIEDEIFRLLENVRDFSLEDRVRLLLALEDIPAFFGIGNELLDNVASMMFEVGFTHFNDKQYTIKYYEEMADILARITGVPVTEVDSLKNEEGEDVSGVFTKDPKTGEVSIKIAKNFQGKPVTPILKNKVKFHEYTHMLFSLLSKEEKGIFGSEAQQYINRVKEYIETRNPDFIKDEYRDNIDKFNRILEPTIELIKKGVFDEKYTPEQIVNEFVATFMGNNASLSSLMYIMKPLTGAKKSGTSLFDAFYNFSFNAILHKLKLPFDTVMDRQNLATEFARFTSSFYKFKLRQIAKITDAVRALEFASVIEDDDTEPNIKPVEINYTPHKITDEDLGIGGESFDIEGMDDTFGLDDFDEESVDPEHDFLRDKEAMTPFIRSKMFRVLASIQGYQDTLDIYEVARRMTEEQFYDSFTVKPTDSQNVKERKAVLNKALLATIPYKGMSKFDLTDEQKRQKTIRALFVLLKNTENKQLYGIESRRLTDIETGEAAYKLRIVKRPAVFRVEGVQRTSVRGNTILEEEYLPILQETLGLPLEVGYISDYNYKKRNGEVVSQKIHNALRWMRKEQVTNSAVGKLAKEFWDNNIIYLLPFADKNTSPLLVFRPEDKNLIQQKLLEYYETYSELFGNRPFDPTIPHHMGLIMSMTARMIVYEIQYYNNPQNVLDNKQSTVTGRNYREMMKRHVPAVQTGRPVYSKTLSKEIKALGFVVDENTIPEEATDAEQPAFKYQTDKDGNITEVFVKLAVLFGEGNPDPLWTNRHGKFRHDGATYGLKNRFGALITLAHGSMNLGANKDYIVFKNMFGKHSEQYIGEDKAGGIGNAMINSNIGLLMMNSNEKNMFKKGGVPLGIPVWDAEGNIVNNLVQYEVKSFEDLLAGNIKALYVPLSAMHRIGAAHSNKNETNGFQQSINSSGLTQTNPAVTPTLNKIAHTFAKLLAVKFRDELMEDPISERRPRITGHKKLFVSYARGAIKSPQGHLQATFSDMFNHLGDIKDDVTFWNAIQPLMYHELIFNVLIDYLGNRLRDFVKMTHSGNMLTLHTDGGNLFPERVRIIKEDITNYMVVPKFNEGIYDYLNLDAKYRKLKYEIDYKRAKKEDVSELYPELRRYQDILARMGDPYAEHKKKMETNPEYRAKIEEESSKLHKRYLDENGFLKKHTLVLDQKTADRLGAKVGDTIIPAILPTDSAMGLYSGILIGVLPNDMISDSAIILPSEYVQLVGKDFDLDKIVTLVYDSRYLSHQDWKTLAKEIQVMQENYLRKVVRLTLKDNTAEPTDENIKKVFVDKGEGSLLSFVKELYGEKQANDFISPWSIEAFQLGDNYYKKVGYVVIMRQLHQYLGNANFRIIVPGVIDINFGDPELWFENHVGMMKLTNDQVDYPNPMDKDFYYNDETDLFYAMVGLKKDKATIQQKKVVRILMQVFGLKTKGGKKFDLLPALLNVPRFRADFEGEYSRVQNTTNSIIMSKNVTEKLRSVLEEELNSAFENKKIEVTTDTKIKYPLEEMVDGIADELKSANFYSADTNPDIVKNLTRKTEYKVLTDMFRANMQEYFGSDFIEAVLRLIDFGLLEFGKGARGFEIRQKIIDETGREGIAKDKRMNKAESQYTLILSRNLGEWVDFEQKTLINVFPYDENNKFVTEDRADKYILLTNNVSKLKENTKMKVISNIQKITFEDIAQNKIVLFDEGFYLSDIVNHIESFAGMDFRSRSQKLRDDIAELEGKNVRTRWESMRLNAHRRALTNLEADKERMEGKQRDLTDVFLRTNQQFGLSHVDEQLYELYATIYFAVTGKTELGFEYVNRETGENKIVIDREHIAAYPVRSTILPKMIRIALDNPNYKIYKSNINTLVRDINSNQMVQLNPKTQQLELKETDSNGEVKTLTSVRNYKSDIRIYNILMNEDNYRGYEDKAKSDKAEKNRFSVDAAFNFSHYNTVSAQDRLGVAAEYINSLTEEQRAKLPQVFTLMMGIPATAKAAINLHGFGYSTANENLYRLMARYTPKLWQTYLDKYSKYTTVSGIQYASVVEEDAEMEHSVNVASILAANSSNTDKTISQFRKFAEQNPEGAYQTLLKLALETDVRYEAAKLGKNYREILNDIKEGNLNWYNSILNLKGKEPRLAKTEVYTMIFRELKTLQNYVAKHKDKAHLENYFGIGRKTFSSLVRSFELKTYNRLYHNPNNPLFYMPDFVNKKPKFIKPIDVIDYTLAATPFTERETGLRPFGNLAVLHYNVIRTDELMYALRNDILSHLNVRNKHIYGQLINKVKNPKGRRVQDNVLDRQEFEALTWYYEQELNGVKELYVKQTNPNEAQVLMFDSQNKLIFQARINLTTGQYLHEAVGKIFDIKNNPAENKPAEGFIASRFKWLRDDTPYHRAAFAAALQSKVVYHASLPNIVESVLTYLKVMKELVQHPTYKLEIEQLVKRFNRYKHLFIVNTTEEKEVVETKDGKKITVRKFSPVVFDREEFIQQYLEINPDKTYEDARKITGFDTYYIPFFHNNLYSTYPRSIQGFNKDLIFIDRLMGDVHRTVNEVALMAYHTNALAMGENQHIINVVMKKSLDAVHPVRLAKAEPLQNIAFGKFITFFTFEESMEGNRYVKTHYGELVKRNQNTITVRQDGIDEEFQRNRIMAFRRDLTEMSGAGYIENAAIVIDKGQGKKFVDKMNYFIRDWAGISILGLQYMPRSATVNLVGSSFQALQEKPAYVLKFFGGNEKIAKSARVENAEVNEALKYISVLGSVTLDVLGETVGTEYSRYQEADTKTKKFIRTLEMYKALLNESPLEKMYHDATSKIILRIRDINSELKQMEEVQGVYVSALKDYNDLKKEKQSLYKTLKFLRAKYRFTAQEIEELEDPDFQELFTRIKDADDIGLYIDLNPKTIKKLRKEYLSRRVKDANYWAMRWVEERIRPKVLAMAVDLVNQGNFEDMTDERALNFAATYVRTTQGHFKWYQERLSKKGSLGAMMYLLHSFSLHAIDRFRRVMSDANYTRLLYGLQLNGFITIKGEKVAMNPQRNLFNMFYINMVLFNLSSKIWGLSFLMNPVLYPFFFTIKYILDALDPDDNEANAKAFKFIILSWIQLMVGWGGAILPSAGLTAIAYQEGDWTLLLPRAWKDVYTPIGGETAPTMVERTEADERSSQFQEIINRLTGFAKGRRSWDWKVIFDFIIPFRDDLEDLTYDNEAARREDYIRRKLERTKKYPEIKEYYEEQKDIFEE